MSDSPLETVLHDASRVLGEAGVRFALTDGVAAILHGSTRATRDVDLSVAIEAPRVAALGALLGRSGFSDVRQAGSVIQASHPNGYRLDLLVADSAFEGAVIAGAVMRSLAGGAVPLARLEDVIAFKLLAGRPRDLRDIEELLERHPAPDVGRLRAMLALLDVETTHEEWSAALASEDVRPFLRGVASAIRS